MTTVELRGVNRVFPDGTHALRDLDLTIRDGEFFVMVGPSGCGKTTALRIIAGLDDPTSGAVFVDGEDVVGEPASRRDLAMVFQQFALYPHMTVEANIGFPLKMAGVPHRDVERRVHAVAELLRVDDVLDRRPGRISGGQRQRVAMARAIIREPSLFLMDEPMSNLDAALRVETRAEIQRIQKRLGVTTVYVTHDQVEAMAMAHRIALMNDGRIAQLGTPDELYETPASLFVATFMGSPAMNALRATIVEEGDDIGLVVGGSVVWLGERGRRRLPGVCAMIGRDVVVGVRPEDLVRDEDGPFIADVSLVEHVGANQIVYGTLPGSHRDPTRRQLCAVVDAAVEVNQWRSLPLSPDLDRLHLFDPVTGRPLCR